MKIMTFNLRFDNAQDGSNGWPHRRDMLVDVIKHHQPAILGTQEGMERQLVFLQESLPGYRMHAPRRTWDDTCQYPTLFTRRDAFDVLDGGEFWLSLTPDVHRSKNWDSAFPRMMSYGLLRDRAANRTLWVLVTHLDHMGGEARIRQAGLIASWLNERREPCILLGDFNDFPESAVHHVLIRPATILADTWQVLEKSENEASMTHHDFYGVPGKCRMDWILVSPHFCVRDAAVLRDNRNGKYPSDHFPYATELEWD